MTLLEIAVDDKTLRPYQFESKLEIYKAWEHSPSIMFQMPTGTGKTRLFSSIIKDIQKLSVSKRERIGILVLVHRTELIEQIHETLLFKYGVSHGIIKSGYEEDHTMPVQIASVQSLTRRIEQWKQKSFSYIIIDEAHHALAKTYRKICNAFHDARVLGVTATPYRLSGESFRDLFGKLIVSQSVSKFIEQGYLSQYNYYSIKQSSSIQHEIDEINEFGSDGDYSEQALIRVCDKDHIRAELVKAYKQYALGKKGIIYTINCAHNEHVCNEFKKIGLRVVAIDGKTPNEKRKQYVSDFRAGNIDIICNVNIFSEGFDCPDIEFIQLARPTLSLALYLQQVGRALRPHARKNEAIIIDNVGLYNRFGIPSANRQWKRHFEGKASAKEEQKKLKAQQAANHRTQDFDEGDENLELIYSCSTDPATASSTSAFEFDNLQTLSDLYFKSEIFPIGLKRFIREVEDNESIRQFDEDNPDASNQERRDYLSKIASLNRLVDRITRFEARQFDDIYDWIDELESAIIFDDYDSYDLIENYKESIRKFKYKGKYGIGKRKDECLEVVKSTDNEVIKSMRTDISSLNDIFEILLEPIYDEIDIPNSAGVIKCIKDGKAGVIDEYSRTEVVPFKYDGIDEIINKETYIVKKGSFYGLYLKGELLLKTEYDFIGSQHTDLVYAPTTFIVLKDHQFGYYNTEDENSGCIWNVKPTLRLNERYYLADSPHNGFWFIATKDGKIAFPYLTSSIAVTDNPKIPFVLSYNKQNKTYLSDDLNILTPETKEDRIEITSLSYTDKYLNGKKEPKKKKKEKNKEKDTKTEIAVENIDKGTNCEKDDPIQNSDKTEDHAVNDDARINDTEYDKITHLHSYFYKFCRNHKWGILTKINDKVVKVVLEPDYRKICKYENSKKLYVITLEDFSNRYVYLDGLSLELETEKIKTKYKSHQIIVTAVESEFHIYIDAKEKFKIQADEIEVLYDGVFKYKQNNLYGLLKVTLDNRVKIAKEAMFEEIEIHNIANNQFLGHVKGKRPRLFTL